MAEEPSKFEPIELSPTEPYKEILDDPNLKEKYVIIAETAFSLKTRLPSHAVVIGATDVISRDDFLLRGKMLENAVAMGYETNLSPDIPIFITLNWAEPKPEHRMSIRRSFSKIESWPKG